MRNKQLEEYLVASRDGIAQRLPPGTDVDKFCRMAVAACVANDQLARADRAAVLKAIYRAAEVGVVPDGKLAAVVLRGKGGQATYQLMRDGVLQLIRMHAEVESIVLETVDSKDEFEYFVDAEARWGFTLRHNRKVLSPTWETCRAAYMMVVFKGGARMARVVWRNELAAARSCAQSFGMSIWKGPHWGEMAKKTAIHRFLKDSAVHLKPSEQMDRVRTQIEDEIGKPDEGDEGRPGLIEQERGLASLALKEPPPAGGHIQRITTHGDEAPKEDA